MKKTFTQSVLLITLGIIFAGGGHLVSAKPNNPSAARNRSQPPSKIKKIDEITTNLHNKMQSLPVLFEENKGQFGERIKFLSRGKGFNVLLNANETVFQMPDANCGQRKPAAKIQTSKPCKTLSLTTKMLGANTNAETRGIDEAVTKSGYFIGNDQSRWRNEISNFKAVRFEQIYQGIDVIFRGAEQNLEYDFHIAPNADPNLIQLEFGGIKKVKIDKNGDLIFKFKGIVIRHHQPVAYQMIDGQRQEVSAKFVSLGNNKIGFAVGKYDQTKELIIDPLVTEELPNDSIKYATYLGGSRQDSTQDIAIDSAGYIYLASGCASEDFLDLDGEVNTSVGRESDICVTKLNSEGTQIIYNVVVGGLYYETPWAIDVDNSGNVYVGGETSSPDFPMVNARQTTNSIIDRYYIEGFVFKLNSSGNSLAYSTYHGATTDSNDWVESVDVDANGNLYAVGSTAGSDFPLRNGFQMSANGSNFDAFLSKFSPSGELLYSTLFGSRQSGTWTIGSDIAVDNNGFAYLSGEVSGTSQLPVTAGAYKTGGTDGFVAKFNTNNTGSSSLVYATYTNSLGQAIAIDSNGNAVTAGGTSYSAEFGEKLNSAGTGAIFTFTTNGEVRDIAIDNAGNSYFIEDAHLIEGYFRSTDVKVTGYSPTGNLLGTAVIKGEYRDTATGIALDSNKRIFVVGYTASRNFPTTENALQPQSRYAIQGGSSVQGFLARVEFEPPEREPLIFIPGIGGSTLYEADENGNPTENLWTDGLTQLFPPTQKLGKLSLNPDDAPFPKVVPVDAVRSILVQDIYGSFLQDLAEDGNYVEKVGCSEQYMGEKPTLFIFPYDWRLSNIDSASKFEAFMSCIRQLYPDKRVNVLTHSMGGLIARRYIIEHPNNENIDKLITMVAPWLGAPKVIDTLFTGKFLTLGVYSGSVKNIVRFGEGPHELLPSSSYFINGGQPFAYRSALSSTPEVYSYTQTYEFINEEFSSQPYVNSAIFHQDEPRQDNWANDTSGIKYYHLYGVQKCDNTIGQIIVRPSLLYPLSIDRVRYSVKNKFIKGDKTVPVLSANRPSNMLAPNTTVIPFNSPTCSEDEQYEHNGILKNTNFKSEILGILNGNSNQGLSAKNVTTNKSIKTENERESFNSEDLMNYLSITGVNRLDISDDQGNTNTSLGVVDRPIPGISYEYGSVVDETLEVPHEVAFLSGKMVEIKFTATTEKINIENVKGQGRENAVEAAKYLDLQLPANSIALLRFSVNGVENLRYDADGDGVFEMEVQPTFHLIGESANDVTPPSIDISFSVNNNNVATITVNASDSETGINQIRYIAKGETSDHVYNAPFTVNLSQSKLIYVSAEDNAGNRNLLAKWIDVSAPITTATQNPTPNNKGWSKTDVGVEVKALDDLGGSGVESLTFSGSGAQTVPEEILSVREIPFTFPQPSTMGDSLSKSLNINMEGITNLNFFAKDKAGNVEAAKTLAVKIDKTAPLSSHNYSTNGSQATVVLTSNDSLSGVASIFYSVDGGALQTYTSPFNVSGVGNHTVNYYATDTAGNSESSKTFNLTITNANPTQAIRPILECVQANPNGTFRAFFGYDSDNISAVSIAVGGHNKFTPAPQDKGQPTVFQPGVFRNVFSVEFSGREITWSIKGPDNNRRDVQASNSSVPCP